MPDAAIVATGPSVSADLVIRVIRAGAVEFLRRPVDRADVAAALDKIARFRRGARAPQPRAGASRRCSPQREAWASPPWRSNLAVCLAEREPDARCSIELDSRHSDIATFLNLRPTYSVLDAFENIERLDESFLRGLLVRHAQRPLGAARARPHGAATADGRAGAGGTRDHALPLR